MRDMSLTDAYRTVVLEHNRAPRRRGRLAAPDVSAEGVNKLCGDSLTLDLRIVAERITAYGFDAEASALTLAATSIMGDLIEGRTVDEATELANAATIPWTAPAPVLSPLNVQPTGFAPNLVVTRSDLAGRSARTLPSSGHLPENWAGSSRGRFFRVFLRCTR